MMENEPASSSTTDADRHAVALVLTACAVSALMTFLVYSQNFIFGSRAGNWIYAYFKPTPWVPGWLIMLALVMVALMICCGRMWIGSHEKITLAGGFLVAVVLQLLMRGVYPVSLGAIVQSDIADSFYSPAMRYSPADILTQFNLLAATFPLHAKGNMPGKILLFELFKPFTSSPETMGYLVVVFSTLGGLLLYGICKQLFHDRLTACYGFILYALVPCKLFFFPILNTATPVFVLLCFYLFLVYLERRQLVFIWLLGAGLYLLVLFEPSPLILGILFAGMLLKAVADQRISIKASGFLVLNLLAAFLAVYVLFWVFFSFDLLHTFQYVLNDAVDFNAKAGRGYRVWLGENAKEFFYGAGTAVTILFIYSTGRILSEWKGLGNQLSRWPLEYVYTLGVLATFCAVLFLGVNRGEVTRLWIYLAVFFQVPAAVFLAKIKNGEWLFFLVAATLVVQGMLTLQMVGFI